MSILGKLEKDILKFVYKYKDSGWHSVSQDSITKRVAKSLQKKGYIEINKYHQMRITKKGIKKIEGKKR